MSDYQSQDTTGSHAMEQIPNSLDPLNTNNNLVNTHRSTNILSNANNDDTNFDESDDPLNLSSIEPDPQVQPIPQSQHEMVSNLAQSLNANRSTQEHLPRQNNPNTNINIYSNSNPNPNPNPNTNSNINTNLNNQYNNNNINNNINNISTTETHSMPTYNKQQYLNQYQYQSGLNNNNYNNMNSPPLQAIHSVPNIHNPRMINHNSMPFGTPTNGMFNSTPGNNNISTSMPNVFGAGNGNGNGNINRIRIASGGGSDSPNQQLLTPLRSAQQHKSSFAIAKFKHDKKYDLEWNKIRSRYVMALFCIMVCTLILVIFLLIPQSIEFDSIKLNNDSNLFNAYIRTFLNNNNDINELNIGTNNSNSTKTTPNPTTVTVMRNVTVATSFEIIIVNNNYVPLTVEKYSFEYYFVCSSAPCEYEETTIGTITGSDEDKTTVDRRGKGEYNVNVTGTFGPGTEQSIYENWKQTCPNGTDTRNDAHYFLNIVGELTFSYALRGGDTHSLGLIQILVHCNGTGYISDA